jgi:DNA-binding GntR family transcriptional regulator
MVQLSSANRAGPVGGRRGTSDITSVQYERLRHAIAEGAYGPGAMLLETVISTDFGVSRTPVREALSRLEQDGLVERAPRGWRVRTRSPEEILDIYEARLALEAAAARAAADRRTPFDLARLVSTHEQAAQAVAEGRHEAVPKLFAQWHTALREASHNRTFDELITRICSQLVGFPTPSEGPQNQALSLAEHEQVVGAVRDRDSDRAATKMAEHLARARDVRMELFLHADGESAGTV